MAMKTASKQFRQLDGETNFTAQLRQAGLRPTRQRLAIAQLLLDGRHRHVTADSLAREIQNTGMHMAVGTVYNTLNQFTDAGLLRRVTLHNENSMFDTNTQNHHHFYDDETNQLYDVPAEEIMLATLPEVPSGYDIQDVDIVIHITPKTQ
jgi:Fur family iron response transcriptional regulator